MTTFPAGKTTAASALFFFFVFTAHAQLSCADLHNGTFHYYPKKSSAHIYCQRQGDLQYENDDSNTDTTVWQVQWTGDCTYTEKYISGSHTITRKRLAFMNKHVLGYRVIRVTDDYYVAKEYLDNKSLIYIETDTIWFHERLTFANNGLFEHYSNAAAAKSIFRDTSQYAILYVYRPAKVSNSLGSYPVYLDSSLLCIAQNNSVSMFKVLKEGKFILSSRLYKDVSNLPLDIHFGHIYYVKSMVHWAITSRLYNFKLENVLVDPQTDKSAREEINF